MARGSAAAGDEIYRRLQLSLLLRVIMVTFLLGATIFIHFSRKPSFLTIPLIALYVLSGTTYFITLISLLTLRWFRRFTWFALAQITWELIFVSVLIYLTGGVDSPFSFMYLLAIIMGGILVYRRGTFFAAVLGTVFYGLVISGLEKNLIPPAIRELYHPVGWTEIIYSFFINLAAMFGMAVFSSYLTEKLRTTGDELKVTQHDRDVLEALNDNIVRSISSGLITLDLNGRITALNKVAGKIMGVPEALAQGQDLKNLFAPASLVLPEDPTALTEDVSRHEVICWESPDERRTYLEFRVAPLRGGDNELLGTLVIFHDVTELREMEDRLRKSDRLAVVGQLAAGMAHEIRNPLASISGSIEILAQDFRADDISQRLMRIVLRETERLNGLIKDFLLYARPAPRNLRLIRLDQLIEEIVEVYQHGKDLCVPISWDLQIRPGLELRSDPKLLEQILWNLINNAIEAMPAGGRITLRGRPGEGEAGEVRLEVEDTGKGISPRDRDKIFDPFFTTREAGTGLGLSIVYRIVEAMNGTIAVEDVKGGGARFVIKVPNQGEAESATDSAGPESSAAGAPKT